MKRNRRNFFCREMFLSGFPFFYEKRPQKKLNRPKSIRIFIRESDDGGDDRIHVKKDWS